MLLWHYKQHQNLIALFFRYNNFERDVKMSQLGLFGNYSQKVGLITRQSVFVLEFNK
jgi:hypothetical protein